MRVCVCVCARACAFATQVGPGWLNPTEEEVWPLAEALSVAHLAFQGLKPEQEQGANGDGMYTTHIYAELLSNRLSAGAAKPLFWCLAHATKRAYC